MLPAFPINARGKQLSPLDFSLVTHTTTLFKLNHGKSPRPVTPFHKRVPSPALGFPKTRIDLKPNNLLPSFPAREHYTTMF